MGLDINNANLDAYAVFRSLDKRDGAADGKINKSIWDDFANHVGGKHIERFITEDNATRSIRYYLKKSGEAVKNYISNLLGYNQDAAQTYLTTAEQTLSDVASGKEEVEIKKYDDDKFKHAKLPDGRWIQAYYDNKGNITKIAISTDTIQNHVVADSIDDTGDYAEVLFDADEAWVEGETGTERNGLCEYQLTSGYDFEKYKKQAEQIFGKWED